MSALKKDPAEAGPVGWDITKTWWESDRKMSDAKKSKSIAPLTDRDAAELVSAVILQFPAKQVAHAAHSTVEAAKKWRRGMNAMSLSHAINAARQIPELRSMLVALMQPEGREEIYDPYVMTLFMQGVLRAAELEGAAGDFARTFLMGLAKSTATV